VTVHGMLAESAERFAQATALTCGESSWTFADLDAAADVMARELVARGVQPGDRVALLAENSVEYVTAFFGILRAGACTVALNHSNKSRSHNHLLQNSGAVGLVGRLAQCRKLAEICEGVDSLRFVCLDKTPDALPRPDGVDVFAFPHDGRADQDLPIVDKDDLALILYTSGSTGKPRGVTLSHANLVANTEQILAYLRLDESDSICCVLPFHYSFGNSLLLTHIKCGGRVVVDNRFAFPAKVLDTLQQERCTGFSGVPSHYAILTARTDFLQRSHPDLRYVTQAGGAMSPSLVRTLHEQLPEHVRLFVMYGQTEASARLSWLPPDRLPEKIGSIGTAIPGVRLTIRRPDGAECDPGETGEIVADGPNIMQRYWDDPEETAQVLHADGLHTGDLAFKDDDGFIFIVDRLKNMIKAGANRVSAKEIEETILELPDVVEACVLGVPDEMVGEAIEAWLVLQDTASPDEQAVLRHCQQNLAIFKIPRCLHFVDSIPKSESGKVLKQKLLD
jgi:long-chain acyl-CoA synthetase